MRLILAALFVACSLGLIAGCGGSGGSMPAHPTPPPKNPILVSPQPMDSGAVGNKAAAGGLKPLKGGRRGGHAVGRC